MSVLRQPRSVSHFLDLDRYMRHWAHNTIYDLTTPVPGQVRRE